MSARLVRVAVLVASLLASASPQCLTPDDNKLPNARGNVGLYTGQQDFSLALLQAINQLQPADNLFFSPYSTYHALLLAYFVSANKTEGYLKETLRLDAKQDKADVYAAYKLDKYAAQLQNGKKPYEFNSANKMYVSNQVTIRECMASIFGSELEQTDFVADPEAARSKINAWVEEVTRTMIKDLLPSGSIDKETKLVLVNAAYFKGIWENKFDPMETRPEVFYVSPSKQVMVDMMHVEGTFNHEVSEDLMAHILELPYKGEDISMFILLPPFTKEDGIQTVLKRLNLERFKEIVSGKTLSSRTVQVSLPKFSLEHTLELVPVLKKIGVGDLFEGGDLSALTGVNNITVGAGLHKAKIEVTEEGTKAAGATVLFSFRSSRPIEPAQFTCNHPFIYLIYDKSAQAVIFTGIFRRPY